jgi:hypothetical protein
MWRHRPICRHRRHPTTPPPSRLGTRWSEDDVVARLREGAHAGPPARFDTRAVLADAKRALRRRRCRQSAAGAVAAGLLALVVASPVHLPGVGWLLGHVNARQPSPRRWRGWSRTWFEKSPDD